MGGDMLKHAFKEWAVICTALAEGRQSIILRKGGIAETADEFHLAHARFWLYPTYVHQQREGIKPEALPLLQKVESERPPHGVIRLTHFAEVPGAYHVHDLPSVLVLAPLHLWSVETVQSRFAYRRPGLYVLPARVYRAAQAIDVPETPAYAGCRSWVELDRELPTDGAVPVLSDEEFSDLQHKLDTILNPTAFA
jgi:hypothetical protein